MTFSFVRTENDHEQGWGRVRLPMSVQGQNSGKFSEIFRNIPILRYIGLIKMLFSSVTKVEPLVLK